MRDLERNAEARVNTTTIVIVDDHPIVRHGLRTLLAQQPGFQVVGEAADGTAAVILIESLKPDVAVIDLMMPDVSGLEVTRRIGRSSPGTRVVILSMYSDEGYVVDTMRGGALGYVLKDCATADLIHAVREVAAGRRYLSHPLTQRAIEVYLERATSNNLDRLETLTPREREVLQLAARGVSNAEIASRLGISPRTVETHRANLMYKLGIHSQTELVHFAIQRRIVPTG